MRVRGTRKRDSGAQMTNAPANLIFTLGAILGGTLTAPIAYQCGKQVGESKGELTGYAHGVREMEKLRDRIEKQERARG